MSPFPAGSCDRTGEVTTPRSAGTSAGIFGRASEPPRAGLAAAALAAGGWLLLMVSLPGAIFLTWWGDCFEETCASATDIASMHVRRGRLQRDDALKLVQMHDGKFPWTYLDKPIAETLAGIDMTFDEFIDVCDRFTNKRLFVTDRRGELVRGPDQHLTKINYDNVEPGPERPH